MSLPKLVSVGCVPASMVSAVVGDKRECFGIDGKMQRTVLVHFLWYENNVSVSDALMVDDWARTARIGDQISFPGCCVTAIG